MSVPYSPERETQRHRPTPSVIIHITLFVMRIKTLSLSSSKAFIPATIIAYNLILTTTTFVAQALYSEIFLKLIETVIAIMLTML